MEALFDRGEKATTAARRKKLFEQIADALAVHRAMEEKISYPAVYGAKTRNVLLEALEEDHACKRIKTDLIALLATGEMYEAKLTVLIEAVENHVAEDGDDISPEAHKRSILYRPEELGVDHRSYGREARRRCEAATAAPAVGGSTCSVDPLIAAAARRSAMAPP